MHKITRIVILLLLTINGAFAQSDKIKIKSDKLKEINYLKMDDFYTTHHLYIDLFLRENLFPTATTADVSAILKAIKKYVSVDTPLEIEIEKPGKRNYLIKMSVLKKEDGTELLIAFTNWNSRERKFEKEIKLENDSYTRWYFLKDNKMTYRKDMSDEKAYSKMTKTDLANAYLFDELYENDSKIKDILNANLKESDLSTSDTIATNLILLKYLIFKRDTYNILKQKEHLHQLFEANKNDMTLKGLEMAFHATKFQIALMQ
ncbi:hypothetical protein KO494_13405 [Lacinutrix sp. C3R15]|uniref:hypothetical protein n=1 Tax=Flavobacteriaceae TaxID=49546 RepID=UPI001C0A20CD|nr:MULTISPECIES: hypothetical protein [Flavobacteriaceae]MBU2940539.1 hypothetical protein [Lacinutrix sp. C3R15]MDO6623859.1 hypothetical protein [Oceanihabitans sp. 1_MG-2023]